jgi:transcriptional antiterminator RfaH
MPQYLKQRRHARRVETVGAPLFPRYVFVSVDVEVQRWRCINSTVGVSKLVCNGDKPATIQRQILGEIRAREDARGMIEVGDTPRFARGDKIRVLDGVFSECHGLFDDVTDGQRVAILLDLLGRKARVVLDMDMVAAA